MCNVYILLLWLLNLSYPSVGENMMAVQGDVGGTKDEIKTQFTTIEGVYKLLPQCEYSRANRVAGYNNSSSSSPTVRVSFICLPEANNGSLNSNSSCNDRTKICFNYGRDLYVYTYKGIKKVNFFGKTF